MGLRAITTSASPLPWSTNIISPLPTFNLFSAQSLKWRKPNASFQGKWGCSSEQKQLKFNGHNSANGSLPNPLGSLVEGGQKIAMVSSRREGLLSLVLLAGCISLAQSKARALGEKGMLTLERYNDNKEGFTLLRPSDWKKVDKAGATVLFEDPEVKSNNIGVVVNPVRISSLKEFGTPQDVADKLLQAEKKKPSTNDAQLIRLEERAVHGDIPLYELEYSLDSTRGIKRVLSAVIVASKKLYLLNIAYSDSRENPLLPNTQKSLEQIVDSFDVLN